MKIHSSSKPRGFTLIELMAVITIIVILAGVVVGGLGYVNEKQDSAKAKIQVALLAKALEDYKSDFGIYPPTANIRDATKPGGTSNSGTILYTLLFYNGFISSSSSSPTKIYISDLDPRYSKQGWLDKPTNATAAPLPTLAIRDPWGNEYCYRSAFPAATVTTTPTANRDTINPDYDLWSMGKDGLTGTPETTADDIKN
jgi:general secretion pathway protein G